MCLARGKASQQVEKHFTISLCIRKLATDLIKENLTKGKVSIDKQVPRKKRNHQTKQITPPNAKICKQTTSPSINKFLGQGKIWSVAGCKFRCSDVAAGLSAAGMETA